MSFNIEVRNPTVEQWMSLRKSVGWATFDLEVAKLSLEATLFCVCAFDEDELIGMGRVLGDGVISFYIGNVMVIPNRQGEGVGKLIIDKIMAYVEAAAVPGAIASLFSIKGKEKFYNKFGFDERPDEKHGPGMSKFY